MRTLTLAAFLVLGAACGGEASPVDSGTLSWETVGAEPCTPGASYVYTERMYDSDPGRPLMIPLGSRFFVLTEACEFFAYTEFGEQARWAYIATGTLSDDEATSLVVDSGLAHLLSIPEPLAVDGVNDINPWHGGETIWSVGPGHRLACGGGSCTDRVTTEVKPAARDMIRALVDLGQPFLAEEYFVRVDSPDDGFLEGIPEWRATVPPEVYGEYFFPADGNREWITAVIEYQQEKGSSEPADTQHEGQIWPVNIRHFLPDYIEQDDDFVWP